MFTDFIVVTVTLFTSITFKQAPFPVPKFKGVTNSIRQHNNLFPRKEYLPCDKKEKIMYESHACISINESFNSVFSNQQKSTLKQFTPDILKIDIH